MCYWLINRSMEPTVRWIEDKFRTNRGSWRQQAHIEGVGSYCEATRHFISAMRVPRKLTPVTLPQHSATRLLALGICYLRRRSPDLRFSRQLSHYSAGFGPFCTSSASIKDFGVMTLQALEDEIGPSITSAIGAAYVRLIVPQTTSGP